MANMLAPNKRKLSLALKIETIKRLDLRAKSDGSTRNLLAEYILASGLKNVKIPPEEQAKVDEEIERNKAKRRGR